MKITSHLHTWSLITHCVNFTFIYCGIWLGVSWNLIVVWSLGPWVSVEHTAGQSSVVPESLETPCDIAGALCARGIPFPLCLVSYIPIRCIIWWPMEFACTLSMGPQIRTDGGMGEISAAIFSCWLQFHSLLFQFFLGDRHLFIQTGLLFQTAGHMFFTVPIEVEWWKFSLRGEIYLKSTFTNFLWFDCAKIMSRVWDKAGSGFPVHFGPRLWFYKHQSTWRSLAISCVVDSNTILVLRQNVLFFVIHVRNWSWLWAGNNVLNFHL